MKTLEQLLLNKHPLILDQRLVEEYQREIIL
jgi:hypothetical protein